APFLPDPPKHEPQRKLLGQRRGRMLLQNPQIRIDLPDPEPTVWPGQNRDLRVHRNLVQQKKKTLLPELPHTRTIRKIKPIKSSLTYCPVFCSKSIMTHYSFVLIFPCM